MDDNTVFDVDPELLAEFVDESQESLSTLDSLFVALEADPENLDVIAAIFRPVHTLKGNSAFFGLLKTKKLAHEMETLLDLATQGRLVPNQSVISVLLAGVDQLKEICARIRDGHGEVEDESLFGELIDKIIGARKTKEGGTRLWTDLLEKLAQAKTDFAELDSAYAEKLDEIISIARQLKVNKTPTLDPIPKRQTKTQDADPRPVLEPKSPSQAGASPEKPQPAKESGKSMRVAEDDIDNFLGYVGELIVTGEMYNHLQGSLSKSGLNTGLAMEFKRLNETFDTLSCNLQNSIMDIRKVPIRTVLQKAPRIIRDIAAANGKEIKVELVGEDTKVDKRLIEILDGPLTHMVRNAADHGIESPEDRQSAGKARQGTVRLAATETEEDIVLTISDDGKGIDLEAIKAKAAKLGIIKPDESLAEEQLIEMLFASGVSTAEKVTEVSGRGVGMDVVKRNIEAANGNISINTQPGQGSEFVIRLQKTVSTQIIDGFLVRVDENCYVIPLDKVREVFSPEGQDMCNVVERGLCVLRHDELLAVVRLSDVFQTDCLSQRHDDNAIMVSTSVGGKKIAFCVDNVLGVQKLVLKDLEGLELNSDVFSSGAVMGDGTVAMVLDVDHLAGKLVGT